MTLFTFIKSVTTYVGKFPITILPIISSLLFIAIFVKLNISLNTTQTNVIKFQKKFDSAKKSYEDLMRTYLDDSMNIKTFYSLDSIISTRKINNDSSKHQKTPKKILKDSVTTK